MKFWASQTRFEVDQISANGNIKSVFRSPAVLPVSAPELVEIDVREAEMTTKLNLCSASGNQGLDVASGQELRELVAVNASINDCVGWPTSLDLIEPKEVKRDLQKL
jgi:hypothetical protein